MRSPANHLLLALQEVYGAVDKFIMGGIHFNHPDGLGTASGASPLGRVCLIFAMGMVLVLVTTLIDPGRSRGSSPQLPSSQRGSSSNLNRPKTERIAGALVGQLQGANHRIHIYAASPEPLYTILSIRGEIQAELLTAAEVALQFPSLPLFIGPSNYPSSTEATLGPESSDALAPLPLLSDMPLDDQY